MERVWAVVILGRRPAETLLPVPRTLEPGSAQNTHGSLQAIRSWLPRNVSASSAAGRGVAFPPQGTGCEKCGKATSAGTSLGTAQIRKNSLYL